MASGCDLVVVGAGHAGCEAARAAARLGLDVIVLNLDDSRPAWLSCNPAMGGPGKSQLLREIDALGGISPRVTDRAAVAVRTLNRTRGASARAARAQCDRAGYSAAMRTALDEEPRIRLVRGEATDLLLERGRAAGVTLRDGATIRARALLVACGTFLAGTIHIGSERRPGGRLDEPASDALAACLRATGHHPLRFKTGTPPRIDRRTVDLAGLAVEPGERPRRRFSLLSPPAPAGPDLDCHALRTTAATRELLLARLGESALYGGGIAGTGPRYCPSLEAKFVRFPEKANHPLFLEPEGAATAEAYLAGFSNSLPLPVQIELVRTLPGFARARLLAPGYAVEYDAFDPLDLHATLESRLIPGLYLAGQVNGTSGYEEAAAQGLVAGVNAAFALLGRRPWVPAAARSYLGALVADLVTRGVDEPYRMMPSRVENRLELREDNADLRLAADAATLGLLDDRELAVFGARAERLRLERDRLEARRIDRGDPACTDLIARHPDAAGRTLARFLRRPEAGYEELARAGLGALDDPEDAITLETEIKYEGYLARERDEIARRAATDAAPIPASLDLSGLVNLSAEARERFARRRPATLGEAARAPGVTAADLAALYIASRRAETTQGARP